MPQSISLPVTARYTLGRAPRAPVRFCVALDFDGCLVRSDWPRIGEEMPGAVSFLRWLEERDFDRVFWSCRTGVLLEGALAWLAARGLPRKWWTEVNATPAPIVDLYGNDCRKVGSHAFVDDRAVGFPCHPGDGNAPDWPRIQAELDARAAVWRASAGSP